MRDSSEGSAARWLSFGIGVLVLVIVVGMLPAGGGIVSRAAAPAHLGTPGAGSSAPAPTITPFRAAPAVSTPGASLLPPSHVRLGSVDLPGPHLKSWGSRGLPPGSEALGPAGWGGGGGSGGSGYTPPSWDNRFCAGLWPTFETGGAAAAQGAYASGCYGHDEPGIQFESNLPGSGGNVSWNITLPTDRSPTQNQSDLYSAIWFGMTMNDPYGWLGECFLELQFYPDQTWYNPGPLYSNYTVNGAWVGAAVAWQIESATGYEDPCFYEPLYLNGAPGPAFLNMTQGDKIAITMTGWGTSTTGEQLSILDTTTGQGSNLTMYNYAQGYPVDPAYSRSAYEASMQWTPGGEFPVSFAFETGHAGNPDWPYNNSYGGCSGGPASTPQDPGAPCPSYDSGSWANDTLTPWIIHPPTFFNAKTSDHPAQVAFTQPEGGIDLVDETSNGVCNGMEGSAWCTYPWYSYYCGNHAFEFGALDYQGVTSDFGKYTQFSDNLETLSFGGSFFPPTNFSIPTCGSANGTVSLGPSASGGGSVYFLHSAVAAVTSFPALAFGTYSIHALGGPGMGFAHWTTSGSVRVANASGAWSTLIVSGSGSIRAVFTATPALTKVTFHDSPKGSIGVDGSFLWKGSGAALATVPAGGNLSLPSGDYTLQAYPRPGYNFTGWDWSGGVSVAAPQFPYTYFVVTGATANASVTAYYTPTTTNGTLYLYVVGAGTVKFGTLSVTNSNPFTYNAGAAAMPSGSYPLLLTPAKGTLSWQILYGPPLVISNNALKTTASIENGTAFLEVVFNAAAKVVFHVSPTGAAGSIWAMGPSGLTKVPSGGIDLTLGYYQLFAAPAAGYAFTGWVTNNPSGIAFSSLSLMTTASVFGNGRITATFVSTTTTGTLNLKVGTSKLAGSITLDAGTTYGSPSTILGLAAGQHLVTANPSAGWSFVGWRTMGHVSLIGSAFSPTTVVSLTPGKGAVWAVFSPVLFPVSFFVWNYHATGALTGTLSINGVTLAQGETTWLPAGTYNITLTAPRPLAAWVVEGNGLAVGANSATTTVKVTGSGSLEADLS